MTAYKRALIIAFAALPALNAAPDPDPCSDDASHTFTGIYSGETYDCAWLTKNKNEAINQKRKDIYCVLDQQLTACAKTCGVCDSVITTPEPTPTPTSAPTSTPTVSSVPTVSSAPTRAPTLGTKSPTSAPVVTCEDTDGYTFSLKNVAGIQGCDWLCRNKKVSKFEFRKTTYCDENPDIAANCCASCAAGRGCTRTTTEVPPTRVPTKAPTKVPTKAPSPSKGKGSVKTPSMPSKGKGR